MFHPVEHPMERGWVGRIEDGHVVHLAAQTLQSYFTGGGARDHAVYPLAAVRLLAPVLHPPSIRAFEDERSFEFRNPAAVIGPGAAVPPGLGLHPRLAAVVGADGEIAGFTVCADWRDSRAHPPKDRDFALGLGPAVVTPDELPLEPGEAIVTVNGDEVLRTTPPAFDWAAARDFAAARTALYPGDLLLAPAAADALAPSRAVSVDFASIGPLVQAVDARG